MVRRTLFFHGISILFGIIKEKNHANDEQISQDSWNKYPTVVDLFYNAPRNWRTMLTLAAECLLKLLKLQVKLVHQ